jgi:hypothetical protein
MDKYIFIEDFLQNSTLTLEPTHPINFYTNWTSMYNL